MPVPSQECDDWKMCACRTYNNNNVYTLVNAHEINMGIKGKIKSCHYTARYMTVQNWKKKLAALYLFYTPNHLNPRPKKKKKGIKKEDERCLVRFIYTRHESYTNSSLR